ncbi:MAG TPA: RDD family protein [Telluria sp.]
MLDGRLSLTTPEGVRLLLTPAGPFLRASAMLIDYLILAVIWGTLMAIVPSGPTIHGILYVLLFFLYWFYPILCEVYWDGRTVGKRATGLQVVRANGLPVGWRESSLRNLLLVADVLPLCFLTGLLSMMIDSRFRRIGDIVAGTLVIHLEKPAARPPAQHAAALPLPFPLNADQQRTLTDLFEREARLPPERMEELGTLAEPLTGVTGAASVARMRGYVAGFTQ